MPFLLDALYLILLVFLSPYLLCQYVCGKVRHGLLAKLRGDGFVRPGNAPCAWFHAVSMGEVLLLRTVVARFRQRHPGWDVVISTTTRTGFDEANKRFPDVPVFWWPLDFSWAVGRALDRVRPDLVVLAECELWPNFVSAAIRRGVRVAVVNGRMSPRSAARWRWAALPLRQMFRGIDLFAVQTEEYAVGVRALGVPADRVHVTGSMKYDGAITDRNNPRTRQLGELLGVREDLVWIAGSTQAPEEALALEVYRSAKAEHPKLRLFLVPRQPERFEEVAALLRRSGVEFVRRSAIADRPVSADVILVDTTGELGALWGLADVAFVGGSLDGSRGGQNMIEPAAYGAAVIFGPHVWNFRDTVRRLLDVEGAIQVADAAELAATVRRLLANRAERERLGAAARRFVAEQQGATERTLVLLDRLLLPLPLAA